MIDQQLILDVHGVNAIDLFAGAGGFSTGAVMAGARVLWAANHWPTAVQWHAANHADTEHACLLLTSCGGSSQSSYMQPTTHRQIQGTKS